VLSDDLHCCLANPPVFVFEHVDNEG